MNNYCWLIFGFYGLMTAVSAGLIVYLIVKRIKSKREEHFDRDN